MKDLEPAVAEAVRKLAASYPRPPHLMSPAEVKAALGPAPAPGPRPPGIAVETGRFDSGGRVVPTRCYRPAGATARIIYFHGGGFTTGGLDSHDSTCAALAADTCAEVVAVDYAKLPEHRFPAAFDDAVAAVRHFSGEGLLAVAGDSSGANLALAAALATRGAVRLAAMLLWYPIIGLDFDTPSYRDNAEAPALTTARCRRIWEDYLGEPVDGPRARRDWRAAPLLADDLGRLPPAVVVTAQLDPLESDGLILAERLQAAGVPVRLHKAPRLPHGFLRWRGLSDIADGVVRAASADLKGILGER